MIELTLTEKKKVLIIVDVQYIKSDLLKFAIILLILPIMVKYIFYIDKFLIKPSFAEKKRKKEMWLKEIMKGRKKNYIC